jgi:hypothetical protein
MLQAYIFYITQFLPYASNNIVRYLLIDAYHMPPKIFTEQKNQQTDTGHGNKSKIKQITYWADIMTEA